MSVDTGYFRKLTALPSSGTLFLLHCSTLLPAASGRPVLLGGWMSALTRDRRHKAGAFPLRIPQNRRRNPLRLRILPVSTFVVICLRGIISISIKTRNFRGGGEGGTHRQIVQTGHAAWRTMVAIQLR